MRRSIAAAVLVLAAWSAHGAAILVEEVCGFGFEPCNELGLTALQQGGPPLGYVADDGGFVFSLAYVGDAFVMEALRDNAIAYESSLPYGLIGWADTGPRVPPIDGIPGTELFFLPSYAFPTLAGEQRVAALPPAQEVPEPGGLALIASALLVLAAVRQRRVLSARRRSGRRAARR